MIHTIYLDNAATTKVAPEVMAVMQPYFSEFYGNPGSVHAHGRRAFRAVERARSQVARPINAEPANIIFTSGGSEANTLAIVGLADHLLSIGKNHIITTMVEHHSVLNAVDYLAHHGFSVTRLIANRDGSIPIDRIAEHVYSRTGLVSVMMVNNETGNMYDIGRVGELCRQHGLLFHTDCVQAYCAANIDVEAANIDFLSASGHKIHAPKGVGFLYARKKEFLTPVVFGGSQEFGLRGGTENVPFIVGMGRAAELAHRWSQNDGSVYAPLLERIRQEILGKLPGVHINGAPFDGSKTLNIRFDGVDGETLLVLLDSKGVAVSAGSACSAHYAAPSHVLKAIGLTDDEARSSIRISVSRYTTSEEIDEAARIIVDSVKQLRKR